MITNGIETKDITWYILALMAKTFAFHPANESRSSDLIATNKLLLQRCANTLSHEQELSGPEVISYIMGWGNRYISHHFVTIPWLMIASALPKTFAVLRRQR